MDLDRCERLPGVEPSLGASVFTGASLGPALLAGGGPGVHAILPAFKTGLPLFLDRVG